MHETTNQSNNDLINLIDKVLIQPEAVQLFYKRKVQYKCLEFVNEFMDFYLPSEMTEKIDFVYSEFVKTLSNGIYHDIKDLTRCVGHIKNVINTFSKISNQSLNFQLTMAYNLVAEIINDSPFLLKNVEQIDHMFRTYLDNIPKGMNIDSDVTLIVHFMKTFLMQLHQLSKDDIITYKNIA